MSLFLYGLFSTYNQVKHMRNRGGVFGGMYMGKKILLSSANPPLNI